MENKKNGLAWTFQAKDYEIICQKSSFLNKTSIDKAYYFTHHSKLTGAISVEYSLIRELFKWTNSEIDEILKDVGFKQVNYFRDGLTVATK